MKIFENRTAMLVLTLIVISLATVNLVVLLSHIDDRRPEALTIGTIVFAFFFSWASFRYWREAKRNRIG